MNNEDKVKNYKMKKIYKSLIIILSLLTIILESFALFGTISFLWGFIPFFLSYYFKGLYEDINIKDMFKRKKKCCLEENKTTITLDDKIVNKLEKEDNLKKESIEVIKTSTKNTKKVTKISNTSKRKNNNSSKNYNNKNNSKSTNYKNNKNNNSKTSTKNTNNKKTSSK